MSIEITTFHASDRSVWEQLARGYKAFYKTPTTDQEYAEAWSRLLSNDRVHGLAARLEGRLVGFAHYLFHTSTWAQSVCYLQDLFTAPEARGQGAARHLIEAVARAARQAGAARYYWLTQENNAVARVLYERVAKYNGFIRYDFPLNVDD